MTDRERLAGPALAVAVAAGVGFATFYGKGGLQLGRNTWLEVVALLLGAGVFAAFLRRRPGERLLPGSTALLAFGALVALTALSVLWSLQPELSWREANRTLAYFAVFAAGIGAVRLVPGRWRWVVYGLLGSFAAVALYALASKVFPAALAEDEFYARLREPFGYWNAVGISAAMGLPLALWLGARREAGPRERVLATPLVAVLGLAIALSYSRASVFAALITIAIWLRLVPLRLRSAGLLAVGLAGSAAAAAWVFSRDALTTDGLALAARSDVGEDFGIVIAAMLVGTTLAGAALWQLRDRRPLAPAARELVGRALLGALAALVLAGSATFLATGGGPGERISTLWSDLTAERTDSPRNTPERLRTAANVRGSYYREAGRIWGDHRLRGAGAGSFETARLRHRRTTLDTRHAHGYLPQTLADLGLAGIGVSIWLLVAAARAARRGLAAPEGETWPAERIGLLALGLVAIAFGIHSALDWTWFVPGIAIPGLFAAGWIAGRDSPGPPQGSDAPVSTRTLAALALATVLAVFAVIQPHSAQERSYEGLELAQDGRRFAEARAASDEARDRDPLSAELLFDRATIEIEAGDLDTAKAALIEAVERQPANPDTWLQLGTFQLEQLDDFIEAQRTLSGAVYLDPLGTRTQEQYLAALRSASR